MEAVKVAKVVENYHLKNLTPDIDLNRAEIRLPDINRPALQMTGYFEHFASDRVQLVGFVEYTYVESLSDERKPGSAAGRAAVGGGKPE